MQSIYLTFITISVLISVAVSLHPDLSANLSRVYPNIPKEDHAVFWKFLRLHEKERHLARTTPSNKLRQNHPSQIPKFNCTIYGPSPSNPISVDELYPGDIRVVAALGDSLTAGFGALAEWIWDLFNEYRGVSWDIGGDASVSEGVLTLPNLFKLYNPNIQGYAYGVGDVTTPNAHLDRAITGSRAPDIIAQATDLVSKMKANPLINMTEDWKIITIWIGSNDLCDVCNDVDAIYSPDQYEKNIREAISIIREGIPRVFLNLIEGINPTELYAVNAGWCSWLHSYECPCGSDPDAKVRQTVTDVLAEYNVRLIKIANDTSIQGEDFSIVIQPFLKETAIPRDANGQPDMNYFALDCFHFSGLAHQAAAVGLWNNIFQKVNHKTLKWSPGEPLVCPTVGQHLATIDNSV